MLQGAPLPQLPTLPFGTPWAIAQAFALVVASVGGVLGALMLIRALVHRSSRPQVDHTAAEAEIADLRDVTQHLTGRISELEERLDFAERLLARDRDAERLKGPKA